MVEALLFRLQQGKLRALEATVDSWKQDHEEALAAQDHEVLVAECARQAEDMRRCWQRVWQQAEADQIRDYDATGNELKGLFERVLRVLRAVQEDVATFATRSGHVITGAAELSAAIDDLDRLRAGALRNWPWSDRPRLPVDRAMIEESRAAGQRGEGEDLTDILARVQAGGPLLRG